MRRRGGGVEEIGVGLEVRVHEDVGENILGPPVEHEGEPQEQGHGFPASRGATVEGDVLAGGLPGDEVEHLVRHGGALGGGPDVRKRAAGGAAQQVNVGGGEGDGAGGDAVVPAELVEPPAPGIQQVPEDAAAALGGGQDVDLAHEGRRAAAHQEGVEGLGDDLGIQANRSDEDRLPGRHPWRAFLEPDGHSHAGSHGLADRRWSTGKDARKWDSIPEAVDRSMTLDQNLDFMGKRPSGQGHRALRQLWSTGARTMRGHSRGSPSIRNTGYGSGGWPGCGGVGRGGYFLDAGRAVRRVRHS